MTSLHLNRTVRVRRPAADVFGYAADFGRAKEWREEVIESSMSPAGPMRTGSVLHEVARVAGRTVVTDSLVADYDEPHRYTFTHLRGPLSVSGEYRVTGSGEASELHYRVNVDLRGGWALLAPILRLSGPRVMARSLDEFRFRLEAAARPRTAASTKH